MNCDYCRAEMKPMFTGYYCPNHCDLPADKKAAAKKKDEEIRASAKPNPTTGSVAAPVSTPVQALCHGLCGKPPNYVNDGWGNYYCDNQCISSSGARSTCFARKPPINFATLGKAVSTSTNIWNTGPTVYPDLFTINWGGHTLNVISDPDCPADKPYFLPTGQYAANPILIALKKPYPDFYGDGLVPGPKVRADSSPSGKNWRRDYTESYRRAYHGYADWYEASN